MYRNRNALGALRHRFGHESVRTPVKMPPETPERRDQGLQPYSGEEAALV
jgi:hypothetical protein